MPCPVAVAVGATETAAFHEQSRAYADKLAAAGWPCQLVVQPGMHHFEIVMSLARAGGCAGAHRRQPDGPRRAAGLTDSRELLN